MALSNFLQYVYNVTIYTPTVNMFQEDPLTCAIKANETIASARVELQAGVCQQLLTMEGE